MNWRAKRLKHAQVKQFMPGEYRIYMDRLVMVESGEFSVVTYNGPVAGKALAFSSEEEAKTHLAVMILENS